ncbi:glycosyltransferase family 2 protein [Bradyrhizobium sp. CB1650]|uniref:glycosyltransferase family 2 protein n=1 Tax=Bradyrhizobium sp. CB1650 TaxID=3039153 RepID=UPI002435878B|nr:glycosyltransferase family 2 protein [Bradyrhizobium sp. CB1650]WGD55347.1 glycosyltransferase family 2 protein [Bradyrhizobium sp. CB1650]
MTTIDIVSPVFGEEEAISAFHEALIQSTAPLSNDFTFNFIYVVDPAKDRTEDKLIALAKCDPRITVIIMSRRFGHQAALLAGMDASAGDALIMLDSDLQHPPSLIPEMIQYWRSGAEIVQALRRDGVETSSGKRITSSWFYQILGKISPVKLQSGAADFRLISRRVVELFRSSIREHNPFLRGLMGWVGFTVAYLPFTPAARFKGRSKYTLSALTVFALNGFCSFSKLPLRLCVAAGLVISVLSLLMGAINVVLYFSGSRFVPGWASIFALTSFAIGLNMLFLGVIGEYVGLIFDEVKERPRYIIDKVHKGGGLTAPHAE